MSSQPTDSISDNIVGDIQDSLFTGMFSYILVKIMTGKNPSISGILNMNTLKEGVMAGGGVAVYRRALRPVLNGMLKSQNLDGIAL